MAMTAARRAGPVADINVTPMADIMIVLLIIFMVATPLIRQSRVALPLARTAIEQPESALKVVVTAVGGVSVGDTPSMEIDAFQEYVRMRAQASAEPLEVRIEADRTAAYGYVARVMAACRAAGVEQVGLAARSRMD
jgi:biopolymer transport protein ExbD